MVLAMSLHANQDLQQLSASNHSTIAEPFIFVARDVETYARLREAVTNLPEQPAEFFSSNAVIAVFLGQRPTGGYLVEITVDSRGVVKIAERTPPKGSMQKMVLSAPHKVVSVPVQSSQGLSIELEETWRKKLVPYNSKGGQVVLQAVIAGKKQRVKPKGPIYIMRAGELATFLFGPETSTGDSSQIFEAVSGKLSTLISNQ
jgi:PrcB C-terminal